MSFDEVQSQRQAVRVPGALPRRRLLCALAWVGVMVPALRVAARTGPDPRAGTLLHAARDGDLDAVRRALDAGVPIESRDADDRTPLLLATDRAQLPVVLLLIERGADVNARDRQQDSAFLHDLCGYFISGFGGFFVILIFNVVIGCIPRFCTVGRFFYKMTFSEVGVKRRSKHVACNHQRDIDDNEKCNDER